MWAKGSHVGGIRQKGLLAAVTTPAAVGCRPEHFSTTDDTDPGVMVSADEFNAIGDTMTFDFWGYKPTAESVDGCAFASTLDAAAASRRGFIIRGGMASRSGASGIQFEVYGASTNSHDAYVDAPPPGGGMWPSSWTRGADDLRGPRVHGVVPDRNRHRGWLLTVVSAGDNRLTIGHRVGSVAGRTVDNCGLGPSSIRCAILTGWRSPGALLERFLYRRPTATAYPALAASRWTFSEDAGPILDQIGSSDLIPQLTTGPPWTGRPARLTRMSIVQPTAARRSTRYADGSAETSLMAGEQDCVLCGQWSREFIHLTREHREDPAVRPA